MQVHACMLALHTGRPVKIVYNRDRVLLRPRAPAPGEDVLRARRRPRRQPALRPREGRARRRRVRVVARPRSLATPPASPPARTPCPNARLDAYVMYTNNPPCGAMRGFGAVQVAFAHEAQMDKLAAALGMDPVELRIKNAMEPGSLMPTGQVVPTPAPVAELLEKLRDMPLPPEAPAQRDIRELPGGVANTTDGEGVVRGVGYAVVVQERRLLRGLRRLLDRARAARARRRRRADRRGPHRRGRGRPGRRHRAGADRAHRARRRAGRRPQRRHADRLRRLQLRLAPDLRHRRRRQGRLRGGRASAGRRTASCSRAT